MTTPSRLLVVGLTGSSHIGESFLRAARTLDIEADLCDMHAAWRHRSIAQKLLWKFGGRRPIALEQFGRQVVEQCRVFRPNILLATGRAPLSESALWACRSMGVRCISFLTDDPFNPLMRSPWFLRALPAYDAVFNPREVNLEELRLHGCGRVSYMPFGYDPELFFSEPGTLDETSDLFFAGTAEPSRAEYIGSAIEAGFNLCLHGNYWNRYPKTRGVSRGQADIPALRRGIASCKVALCLVRHENRDGHSMRSFEVPAVGACMAVEDTVDHRNIFGDEGLRVVYFNNPTEMIDKVRILLRDEPLRTRLGDAVHSWIVSGSNTYADRLRIMLEQL